MKRKLFAMALTTVFGLSSMAQTPCNDNVADPVAPEESVNEIVTAQPAEAAVASEDEEGNNQIPVKLYTSSLSEEQVEAQQKFRGEQPVAPLNIEIGMAKLKLWGYGHTGYSYKETDGETSNQIDMTRVILMARGDVTDKLGFFLMFDAASGEMHEYYGEYAFSKGLKVRLGQYKQPFMLENIYSPTVMNNISYNRSVLFLTGIATDPGIGNNVARDQGLMLTGDVIPWHNRTLLNYQIGVFNGVGRNQKENNNEKDLIGMLNFTPWKRWLLSTSFLLGTGHARAARTDSWNGVSRPVYALGEDYRRQRWSLGVDYKSPLFDFRGEYAWGRDAKTYMHGWYTDLEIHIVPQKWDIVCDYDLFNKNHSANGLLTTKTAMAGLQYRIFKKCRVLSQYVRTHPKVGKDTNEWITQLQICF